MRWRVREEAEGCAGILRVRDPEESWDYLDVCVHHDARRDQPLGPAVKQHDDQGKKKMDGARRTMSHSEYRPDSIVIGTVEPAETSWGVRSIISRTAVPKSQSATRRRRYGWRLQSPSF